MKVFLDANVFVYAFLSKDEKGQRALDFIDQIVRGQHEAYTSVLVLDEFIWTLYRHGRTPEEMENALRNVYALPHLEVAGVEGEAALTAVGFMRKYGTRPRDALHCSTMLALGIFNIASDDKDFDKIKEFKRIPF